MPRGNNNNSLRSQYNFIKKIADNGTFRGLVADFEQYYGDLQKDGDMKSSYIPYSHEFLERFVEDLMFKNDKKKSGKLNDEDAQDFEELLNTIQQGEVSFLKKLMRTMLLDMYDSMAGDLDRDNTREKTKYLNQIISLTDLYDRVLNEKDKKELRNAFSNGEAGDFLTNTDHGMDGNFSKTLKALYEEYRKPEQTEAEKAKWKKLCNSYAVRPYMHVVSEKVKTEEKKRASESLPEEEKQRIKALKEESKALKQDANKFVNMSPDERNKIRQAAAAKQVEEMRQPRYQQEIAALNKELQAKSENNSWTHRYLVNEPERLARKTAAFQPSDKDSEQFKRMFNSLITLRRTDGYRNMAKLLAEGKEQELVENLNQAIQHTQEYIAYADQKSIMKMGITGHKRLKAARATLRELTEISNTIRQEAGNLRDAQEKKEKVEDLKLQEKLENESKPETNSKSVQEILSQIDPEYGRRKLNVEELSIKINGKQREWLNVEFADKQNANVQKKADKGMIK